MSPAIGVALRSALSRQGQCFVCSVPRWDSGFRLILTADEKNEVVTDITDGLECLSICAR